MIMDDYIPPVDRYCPVCNAYHPDAVPCPELVKLIDEERGDDVPST
jgi:hypothetical protein